MPPRSHAPRVMTRSASALIVFLFALALTGHHEAGAAASDSAAEAPPEQPDGKPERSYESILDRIWEFATLYDNPEGSVLRKFSLRGRLQADFPIVDGNRGDYNEPQMRRIRLGAETEWLAQLTVHVEVDLDGTCEKGEDCGDGAYEGLTDAYLGWTPHEAFEFKLGKISAPFTLDGTTSSKRLITVERNNISNNLWFPAEYHAGVRAGGKIQNWHYFVGAFSSSTTDEFGSFDGGYFLLLSVAYNFSSRLEIPEFLVSLNYVYNESDPDNVGTRDLSHVVSLHIKLDTGRWGLRSDLSAGLGYYSQSDLVGLALVPFYHITEHFQIVGRYTFLNSFSQNGLRFSRYENKVVSGRGDEYNEFYAGVNWYLYGHRLKLQTGVQYTVMEDGADDGGKFRGWQWSTGVRMSW